MGGIVGLCPLIDISMPEISDFKSLACFFPAYCPIEEGAEDMVSGSGSKDLWLFLMDPLGPDLISNQGTP